MKYLKKSKHAFNRLYITLFVIFFFFLILLNKNIIQRSLITINLGSTYVSYLNEKAEFLNYFKQNQLPTVSLEMSSNNYVRMQQERSKMVSNFVLNGFQWNNDNIYYNLRYNDQNEINKAELKLFGLNPDHFRSSKGHSFRIRFKDAGKGYENKKFNFVNPRSRDFVTDPLINILYKDIFNGIKINYTPLKVLLNKSNYGIMLKEDFFDKYLIEDNNRRESLIFEVTKDSLYFNHKGEDNEFDALSRNLNNLYKSSYSEFLDLVDKEKLRGAMIISLIINDTHPLIDINLHWYFNSVNGLIEPILREGFVNKISLSHNFHKLSESNKLIQDVFVNNKSFFYENLFDDLVEIRRVILENEEYKKIKNQLSGYSKQIKEREKIILSNIDLIISEIEYNDSKDYETESIIIDSDTVISGEYVINKDQYLKIQEGVTIELDNANIRIYGGFQANGSPGNPIIIKNYKKGSGTIFFNSKEKILINNVHFKSLSNSFSNYDQPSSITFYESDSILISDSNFSSNLQGDDYLNFFRCKDVIISNSSFKNILNDAIDSDFSSVRINNLEFNKIGNDAIDGSGSIIDIENTSFEFVLDKSVSAGENSLFSISNSNFKNNEIGIVSKDGSEVTISNVTFLNNKLDFVSFIKKPYYGPSLSRINETLINKYLVESKSKILGIDSIQYSSDVESKLYGNIYGRSSD